uniref:RNA helicase n=1 Tax=Globodera rostochiensis TaxID=31243 RepID=A0A914HCX8_GLORO
MNSSKSSVTETPTEQTEIGSTTTDRSACEALEAIAIEFADDPILALAAKVEEVQGGKDMDRKAPFVVENTEKPVIEVLIDEDDEMENNELEKCGKESEGLAQEESEKTSFVAEIPKKAELGSDQVLDGNASGSEKAERAKKRKVDQIYRGERSVVVQQQNGQVVVMLKRESKGWPRFVGIPNGMPAGADRPLRVGDEVEMVSYEWRPGYEVLAKREYHQHGEIPPWVNVGNVNAQAVAKEIMVGRPSTAGQAMGIVLDVNRRSGKGQKNNIQSLSVISHGMKTVQRLQRWQLGEQNSFRVGQAVLVETVKLTRPNLWKVNPGLAYPSIVRLDYPENERPIIPIEDSNVAIEQAEEAIAAGITACVDKMETEIERFTIKAELKVLPETVGGSGTAVVMIRHVVEKKQELVRMTKIWAEDQPIHARLAREGAKSCASGFIMNLERQEHEQGFVLLVTVFLAFQEAENYDGEADWEQIMEGVPAEIEPLHSRMVLEQRAEKFALHQFTECAKDATGLGKIMANLLARRSQQEAPTTSWQELLAPPGSGKTKSTADIVAAYLRANPKSRALFIAPLNVAVVKAVEEMDRTMKRVGWKEEMLALFSGAHHLLERLNERQSDVASRYIDACEKSPRTANEGKAARVLLSKEKRRVVFCTLSLAEQIGAIFKETDIIVVDESGQAPFAQLLSTLMNFPKLQKLLVTGDRWQLSVYLEEAPEAVRKGLGLDTIIWNLDEAPGVDRTTLTVNFRSHPVLTQCIKAGVYAAHGEVLTAGRRADEMDRRIRWSRIQRRFPPPTRNKHAL